ncbi:MAG: replication protein [Acidobacteriota bacterium]
MKPAQLRTLSEHLNRALQPSRLRQEATTQVLDQFDPLPILQKSTPQTGVKLDTGFTDTGAELTPVPKAQGSASALKSGYLRVPNEILDHVLPRLDPSEAVVFLRLYRLSIGFNQPTCMVGMTGLMRACNLSESTCRRALRRLMELGYLRQLGVLNTREVKGTIYQIETGLDLKPVSNPNRCHPDSGVRVTPNKDDDDLDDSTHDNHHQTPKPDDEDFSHLEALQTAYSQITGNEWVPSDTQAYRENRIAQVPINRLVEVLHGVKNRCGSRINSFNYFVKEILSRSDPRNRQLQKRSLARIVRRVRELHAGAHDYPAADFVFDVKEACAREGVIFDNELFNSLCR